MVISTSPGTTDLTVDLRGTPSGQYILRLVGEDGATDLPLRVMN